MKRRLGKYLISWLLITLDRKKMGKSTILYVLLGLFCLVALIYYYKSVVIGWSLTLGAALTLIAYLVIYRKVKGGTIVYDEVKYPDERDGGENPFTEEYRGYDRTVRESTPAISPPRVLLRSRENEQILDREIEQHRAEDSKPRIILKRDNELS